LSNAIFVATANDLGNIPSPLLDRMDLIEVSGYAFDEKIAISKQYLFPKWLKRCGLTQADFSISDSTIQLLTQTYCIEPGIRNLDRYVERICRKIALKKCSEGDEFKSVSVSEENLEKFIGKQSISDAPIFEDDYFPPGVCRNLSSFPSLSIVEAVTVGEVPSESSLAFERTGVMSNDVLDTSSVAMSFCRSFLYSQGLEKVAKVLDDEKFLVHFRHGKYESMNVGVAMVSSILSKVLNISIPKCYSLCGEISLHGKILPVSNIAQRCVVASIDPCITKVIIPKANEFDLDQVSAAVKQGLEFYLVSDYSEIFELLFAPQLNIVNSPNHKEARLQN
jgi:ATP-dependent Lon protease